STFLRELGPRRLRFGGRPDDMRWGWTTITRMALADGTDLLPTLEFMRPDDGNLEDRSVARVRLPEEVPPGGSVVVEVEFEAQLPSIIARTGFAGDFHLAGQWFPKLGVFEGAGGWNCHQYHANSEFFADFGSYRVTIEVPRGWVVGATGVEIGRMEPPEDHERGLRLAYSAERVHDFAWVAAPGSAMEVVSAEFEPGRDVPREWLERAVRTLGSSAASLELPPTRLRLMVPRSHLKLAERHLHAARLGLAWHGLWYGPYPYPQLTVVVPPPSAVEAGGMEYPTFITATSGWASPMALLEGRSLVETVVIHEIGHQYFYGLLASNEFEEAWLDEGLTSFAELQCREAIAADGLAPALRRGGLWTRERIGQSLVWTHFRIDQPSWEFPSPVQYYSASYGRTALSLRTLEGLLGPANFARAMRTYAERYRFRHPTGDDLFATFSEVAGEDLGWYFEQAFRSEAEVDWEVAEVRHSPRPGAAGEWSIDVDLGRHGGFAGPVSVALEFEDGRRERRSWDGGARRTTWTLDSAQRLERVVVDPDAVWALETKRRDNYWAREESSRAARRALWWVPEALHWLGLVHLPWS
ncbi:MAG TPA: M1 family metallopeptidase, partial [Thermoanaerobaculales bacterium]|nr:M1 family metallopeptidase [Thermoanaerobaculales bacterium]